MESEGEGGLNCLARVPLGPRLAGLAPVFFPLSSRVVAVAGPGAARIVALQPMLSGHIVHQVGDSRLLCGTCGGAQGAGA
jgi:hypothetical protein